MNNIITIIDFRLKRIRNEDSEFKICIKILQIYINELKKHWHDIIEM